MLTHAIHEGFHFVVHHVSSVSSNSIDARMSLLTTAERNCSSRVLPPPLIAAENRRFASAWSSASIVTLPNKCD